MRARVLYFSLILFLFMYLSFILSTMMRPLITNDKITHHF